MAPSSEAWVRTLFKREMGNETDSPTSRATSAGRIFSKFIKVSEALDFNFFSLFCPKQHHISAHLAAVSLDGNANNLIGDAELAVQLSSEKKETENLRETIKLLKEQIESLNSQILRLDSNLKDKDVIIELLKDRE